MWNWAKYVSVLALWLLQIGCRTTSNDSKGKSLHDAWDRMLIPKTVIAVDGTEPVSLMIDTLSDKPREDAKLSIWTLTVILEEVDSEAMCKKTIQSVETRGERGRLQFVQTDHGEGESTYIYAWKLHMPPVSFHEFLISFEPNDKDAKQCRLELRGDGHWELEGDFDYAYESDDPGRDRALRAYSTSYEHRLKHYLWHTTRALWAGLQTQLADIKETNKSGQANDQTRQQEKDIEQSIAEYTRAGWNPPRYFRETDAETALSGAGEDFFYMHRVMLKRVKEELESKGFGMIPAWTVLPKPDDPTFPLAPKGTDRAFLSDAKSDLFFYETQRIWEQAYQMDKVDAAKIEEMAKELLASRKNDDSPEQNDRLAEARKQVETLLNPAEGLKYEGAKGISLSEYGHIIENTIHNNLHTRYQFLSTARPNNADPLDQAVWKDEWSASFDSVNYDWLGDSYSSHVHPWFYRIHGWIDARIQTWLDANGYKSIGSKEDCKASPAPCYVWLSDSRYQNKGSDLPWEGPLAFESKAADVPSQSAMQLKARSKRLHQHAPPIPKFSPRVLKATRGLREQNAFMNRILIQPDLEAKLLARYRKGK